MIQTQIKWNVDPMQKMQRLSQGLRAKAYKIALQAGAAPMKAAVVAAAPKDQGHLAAATIIKVVKKTPDVWFAVIGASTKYKRAKKKKGKNGRSQIVRKKGKDGKEQKVQIRPAAYQKFVDKGTRNMRARNYLTAAFKQAKGQFRSRTLSKLDEVVDQLLRQK